MGRRPALPGDRDADVVIIGAGYSGLWTAYYLLTADPSLRVVVLEKEFVGFGASGLNSGWASAIFPVLLDRILICRVSDMDSDMTLTTLAGAPARRRSRSKAVKVNPAR
ncbi:FAD-dependent oxidoreductase [Streptomyces rhizosphaericus]|uniref:FAD-dependent oxidoreductase n=1 Tax=Streptomyces rhizosphaericus TaxID=114699 RepID=UPI0035D49571